MSDKNKAIMVSKETHKKLSLLKVQGEYDTFEQLLVDKAIEDSKLLTEGVIDE